MYLSDHSKNIISAEEKVAELIKQRDQLRAETERLKHGTVAQFKDAFIDLRASSDEHAKGYVESRKRIAAMESEIDRLHAKNAVLESATARAERAEAEVERLTAQRENLLKPMRDQAIARADRAEADLAAEREKMQLLKLDKDRLDWYNGEPYYKFGKSHKCMNPGWWWSCGYEQVNGKSGIKNIRDTIDSAMAHSKSGRNKYNVMKRLCETNKEGAK